MFPTTVLMESTYVFEKKSNYLYMEIVGKYDFHEFKSYITLILDQCEEENLFKVLIDVLKVEGIDIPAMERFLLAVEEAEQLKQTVRLTVVSTEEYTLMSGAESCGDFLKVQCPARYK
jgi:hypothetical protein